MGLKKTVINSMWGFQTPPALQKAAFSGWSVLTQAWHLSRGQRLRFLLANYIVVCFGLVPILAPFFALRYPQAMLVPYLPTVPPQIAALLSMFMPWCYAFFVDIPLKLGLFLLAIRIVYQKPHLIGSSLFTYLRFFWLINLLLLFIIIGFFIGIPLGYVITHLMLDVFKGMPWLMWTSFGVFCLIALLLAVFTAIWASLLFFGRVALFVGFKTALKTLRRHFWIILGMFVLEIIVYVIGKYTWHVSDVLLVPWSYLVWACLYKRLFGATAHHV